MKRLNLYKQNHIKSYTWYFLPVSIIYNESYYSWIFSNFLNITAKKIIDAHGDNFYYINDFNQIFDVEVKEYNKISNIIDYLIDKIDNDTYIKCELNEGIITSKKKVRKIIHPSLIFGYNKEKSLFYSYGFVRHNQTDEFSIPFDQLLKAIPSRKNKGPFTHNEFTATSYKLKENMGCNFEPADLINFIKSHLFPKKKDDIFYGIDCYDSIIDTAENPVKFNFFNKLYIKFNTIFFIIEHKVTLVMALNYIYKKYNLKSIEKHLKMVEMLSEQFSLLKFLFIKLIMKQKSYRIIITDKNYANELLIKLKEAVSLEVKILNDLLNDLQKVPIAG